MTPRTAVCIPTLDRPDLVRQLLENLLEQDVAPDVVVVIDASDSDATKRVCDELADRFRGSGLRYLASERGLPLQRRRAIEALREGDWQYVCFLDDDVLLAPEYLARLVTFLDSEDGRAFGGVCGYDHVGWGKPFERLDVVYRKVGVFERLTPGAWLFCGYFLELDHLEAGDGVFECDFLPGGNVVWRAEVLDRFLPPSEVAWLGEDKHHSLRVGSAYKLGVVRDAGLWHLHTGGGRPSKLSLAFDALRLQARLLRDCDPAPTVRRYLTFLAFNLVHITLQFGVNVVRRHWRNLPVVGASLVGWVSCVVSPPRRSPEALTAVRRR